MKKGNIITTPTNIDTEVEVMSLFSATTSTTPTSTTTTTAITTPGKHHIPLVLD